MLSTWQILILDVIVLLIFGPKRLPELGKSVGKAIKNFKEGINGVSELESKPDSKTDTASKQENEKNSSES